MPAQASLGGNRTTSSSGPDVDVASSNATANAFLGGRQPSWMSGGVPTSNPRPRPSKQPRPQTVSKQPVQNQTPTQTQKQAPTQHVLPSPAPSDEPSPALFNPLDSPNPPPATLTEKQNMISSGAPDLPDAPVTDARFVPDLLLDQHAPARPGYNGHLQSPSINNPSFSGPGQPGSVLASPQIPAVPSQSRTSTAPSNGQLLAAPQFGQPQSPIVAEGSPQTGENGTGANKRRRTDQTAFKYASFVPQILEYIQICGGEQALSPEVERPRLSLLKDACLREDGFFIALHQLYMLWSNSRHWVYRIVRIEETRTVDAAFTILETVLKKNQLMSTVHREWFAKFPAEISVFMRTVTPYASAVSQVSQFLKKLPDNFKPLSDKSVMRGYPYLVDELLLYLGCYSPVLQMIFFTAARRRLGVYDGPLGSRIEHIFREDQKNHVDRSTGLQVLQPITEIGEIERRNEKTIRFYKAMVDHAAQHPTPLAQPERSSSHPTSSAPRPSILPSASPTISQPMTSGQSSVAHYNHAPSFFQSPTGHSQPSFNSPLMANSPIAHPGVAAQLPSQLILQTNTSYSSGQPTSYTAQGVQQQTGLLADHELQPPYQQMQQMMYQQSLQPYQRAQQVNHQQMYPQQLNQGSLPSGMSPPTGGSNFIQPAAVHHYLSQLAPQQSPSPNLSSVSIPQSGHGPPATVVSNAISHGTRQMSRASSQTIRQNATHSYAPKVLQDRPLMVRGYRIPPNEAPRDPSEHKAILMSLHQAHVRSPKRVVNKNVDGSMEESGPFYQAAKTPFPVGPTAIIPKPRVQEFCFEVTPEQYQLTSRSSTKQGDLLPTVEHFDGSLRWRVRCCKVKKDQPPTEGQFCASDTSWPPNIYMRFNGKPLSIRRRSHNGKDLASELTDLIKSGPNTLQVVLEKEKSDLYFLAVETVETLSHRHVMDMLMSQKSHRVDKEDTLEIIKSRVNRPLDDDDIAFAAPSLSVDLADPFSAVIFKIPVRGSKCTHLECFDLENFLATRLPVKTARKCGHHYVRCNCPPATEPSNPEKWRCPICGRDARPYSLCIDGFLENVRSQLEKKDQLSARSIEVDGEGNWTPVLDSDDGIGDSDDDGPPPSKKRAVPVPAKEKVIEVIELD